jgi:hypothetical protein
VPGGGRASRERLWLLRAREAVNLVNGSTLAGLGVAMAGRARLARAPGRLFIGTGYRLPVPPAPAFCLGNVILTRGDGIDSGSPLFAHEARHATQFACCGGVAMVPMYLAAAGVSWVLTGDFGARNVFERRAGLADGGYTDRPLRPVFRRAISPRAVSRRAVSRRVSGSGLTAGRRSRLDPGRRASARDRSTASPSR